MRSSVRRIRYKGFGLQGCAAVVEHLGRPSGETRCWRPAAVLIFANLFPAHAVVAGNIVPLRLLAPWRPGGSNLQRRSGQSQHGRLPVNMDHFRMADDPRIGLIPAGVQDSPRFNSSILFDDWRRDPLAKCRFFQRALAGLELVVRKPNRRGIGAQPSAPRKFMEAGTGLLADALSAFQEGALCLKDLHNLTNRRKL